MSFRHWKPAWGGFQCTEALLLFWQHVVKSCAIFQENLPNSGATLCVANGLPRLHRRCTSLLLHQSLWLSTLKRLRCKKLGCCCGFVLFFLLEGYKSFQNWSPNCKPCMSSTILLGISQGPIFQGYWGSHGCSSWVAGGLNSCSCRQKEESVIWFGVKWGGKCRQ